MRVNEEGEEEVTQKTTKGDKRKKIALLVVWQISRKVIVVHGSFFKVEWAYEPLRIRIRDKLSTVTRVFPPSLKFERVNVFECV